MSLKYICDYEVVLGFIVWYASLGNVKVKNYLFWYKPLLCMCAIYSPVFHQVPNLILWSLLLLIMTEIGYIRSEFENV